VEVNAGGKPKGSWNDQQCSDKIGFVCEEKCKKLKVHTTKKTWTEARRACQIEGGELVSDDSPEIHEYLAAEKGTLWIGASKSGNVGWNWTNGKSVVKTRWAPGEPNNKGGIENCVEVNAGGKPKGSWNDQRCSDKNGFVCELSVHC